MSSLILVPSLGRPENAARLDEEFAETYVDGDDLFFVVPVDDPTLHDYPDGSTIVIAGTGCMSWDVNVGLGVALAGPKKYDHIGFMGDDHSLKTAEWSRFVSEAGFGIVYGPDGSNNLSRELPTFWFVSTPIVEALGWLSPPYMKHFYLDDAWRELGKASGTLKYVPDLYIEHLHFSFGKSVRDETYEHSMNVGADDNRKYLNYMSSADFDSDVAKIRELRG